MKLRSIVIVMLLLSMNIDAMAQSPSYSIEIHDHYFRPSTVKVPATTIVQLSIYNDDDSDEVFHGLELNRKKVILSGHKVNINIGPLIKGEYPFHGEYHPITAQGVIITE